MRFFDLLKVVPQYLIPKHLLSQAMHWFMQVETSWIKNTSIKLLTKLYKINISEADNEDLESYPHFNAFFTRALKAEARPIDDDPQNWCSPVDGVISQSHPINGNQLIQAKCHDYTLEALLGGDICYAQNFVNGDAAVIYLSPKDYHRIHMPTDGQLLSMTYVPGDLFAVNPATVRSIPGLFARNERLIIRFSNDHGDFCLIMVGAIFVGSMETVWEGKITRNMAPPFDIGITNQTICTFKKVKNWVVLIWVPPWYCLPLPKKYQAWAKSHKIPLSKWAQCWHNIATI